MSSYSDIFGEALGVRSTGEINGVVLDAIKDSTGHTDPELLDAFQHVFETAATRAPREVQAFLTAKPALEQRVRRHANALVLAGLPADADALTRRMRPMQQAAEALKPQPMRTAEDIFGKNLGELRVFEIANRVNSALEVKPGGYSSQELIDAFQHVFETAAKRSQRELAVFLVLLDTLVKRIGEEASQMREADGDPQRGNEYATSAVPMLKAAMQVEAML